MPEMKNVEAKILRGENIETWFLIEKGPHLGSKTNLLMG
jgi:hypothetical protein